MGLFGEPKRSLGIDVGTASIKLAQLALDKENLKLETYGKIWTTKETDGVNTPIFSLTDEEIGAMLSELLKETKAKPQNVTISIPIFSSFITLIELPAINESELAEAVPFEARKYVPVPIEDVTLDWSISNRRKIDDNVEVLDILLVAIPNEVVARYLKIAKIAEIDLKALESEAFGLARGLIGQDKNPVCLVDVGASSTDITIVDEGTVRISHNFDIAGNRLTTAIARSLQVAARKADAIKQDQGLGATGGQNISGIMTPLIDLIINEVNRFISDYITRTSRKVSKLILSGGGSNLSGLAEYFSKKLDVNVMIANPFGSLTYPPILDKKLKITGPSYAVSVGTAMRHFVK